MNESEYPFDMTPASSDSKTTEYYSQVMNETLMKEYVSIAKIEDSINSCMFCPLNEYVKPLKFPKGNETKHLMIIGEDPTDVLPQFENGAILQNLVRECNFNEGNIHYTSLVKCVGSKGFKDCHHHLINEIIAREPKVIIALGYNPAYPFMSHIAKQYNAQISPGLGYTLENGSDMIVVNSPKDIISNIQAMNELKSHLNMAFTHLRNKLSKG